MLEFEPIEVYFVKKKKNGARLTYLTKTEK